MCAGKGTRNHVLLLRRWVVASAIGLWLSPLMFEKRDRTSEWHWLGSLPER